MPTRIKTKPGDIIAIPIDSNLYGFGQIVEGLRPKCFIIYDLLTNLEIPLEQIVNMPVIFLTYITDPIIKTAGWLVIGNIAVTQNITIPQYIVSTVENGIRKYLVSDYSGRILRLATEEEEKQLKTQSFYTSPVIVNAIRAKHGIIPWLDSYNDLLYR